MACKWYLTRNMQEVAQFLYNTSVNLSLELEMGNHFGSVRCLVPQIKIFQDKGFGKILIH